MTVKSPMFIPILAEGDALPQWVTIVGAVGGSGLATGFLAYLAQRGKAKDERRAAQDADGRENRREERVESAQVKLAEISASKEAEKQIFENYKQITAESRAANHALRNEMQQLQTRMELRVQHVEDKLETSKEAYYRIFAVLVTMVTQNKLMKGMLKKLDKEFDESLFPEIEITPFNPQNVYGHGTDPSKTGNTVQFMPGNKTTTRIEVTND